MKIRPFEQYFENELERPATVIAGRVEGGSFVVQALGQTARLAVSRVGSDRHGSFAVLAGEQTVDIAGDFRLEIVVEHDEDLAAGVELRLVCDRNAHTTITAVAGAHGIDEHDAHLVIPPDACFSVYFGSDGKVDGTGMNAPTPKKRDDEPTVH
jgi:hypothetical protein